MPKVTLIHCTPLEIADKAIGKCWDKPSLEGVCNMERIDRVANKNKHASTVEHIHYSFDIDGISRACLQELARHRISSFSVKSTRYTLKELKNEGIDWFNAAGEVTDEAYELVWKYCVKPPELTFEEVTMTLSLANSLGSIAHSKLPMDKAKYMLPEAYKTSLVWTVNARSLQNFLALRTSKAALWEIRELALAIYDTLPEDHKFLFKDYLS